MPPSFSQSAVTLRIILITAVILRSYFNSRRRSRLPPGPPGLPIIGNLHQFTKNMRHTMDKWCQEHGPLVYVNAAGQDVIVIGSHKVASELLDQRASIYSGRPRSIVAGELMTGGFSFIMETYNQNWRRMRRAAHESLNVQSMTKYYPFQEVEAAILVSLLAESSELNEEHLKHTNNSLMTSILYGTPSMLDSKDPVVARIDRAAERVLSAVLPGAYLVELFTWMEHLPRWMCAWRREAEAFFEATTIEFCGLFADVASRLDNGTQRPSVAATFIEENSTYKLRDMEAAWTVGSLYVAGATTASAQMSFFFIAMLLHPESQKRAHEELDRVVGRERMPTLQDYDRLPYIRAVLKEVLRWRPSSFMGGPHTATEDDYYEGYFIPKGTICFANIWGLNHDVNIYGPDAHEFRPERFLGPDGTLVDVIGADTKEEGHVAYGFGRRICVGRYVANNSLFIQMASVLWAFHILPRYDRDGVAVLPDKDALVERGIAMHPAPFQCCMRPRFEDVEGIVSDTRDTRMQASYSSELSDGLSR